jgi:hypothetical protein
MKEYDARRSCGGQPDGCNCTNRDFKGYGVPKWKIVGPEHALKPFLSR